jgi:hypothetical protein
MAEVTFSIPKEIQEIISKHPEVQWEKLVKDSLWNLAKKIQLMDKITAKSKLSEKDVDTLDKTIKADLLKIYESK